MILIRLLHTKRSPRDYTLLQVMGTLRAMIMESHGLQEGGLSHHYLAGLAVDSGDPNTIIVSASQSALHAHNRSESANSLVYRRSSAENVYDNEGGWKPVTKGLPESNGTIISILAANPMIGGEFYAVNNRGVFCSTDSGISWKMLDGVEWPKDYLLQHPQALSVSNG
jgi:hypothetical protein